MRLENRFAIVTGGANGIGRAAALRFAAEGAQVAIWDMVQDAGQALADQIGKARFQAVNVADPESVESAVAELVQDWGRIDILVNNAGILRDAQLVSYKEGELRGRMSVEDYDAVLGVNLRGVFLCTRAVAPVMIRQNYGRIISTSSVVGLYGNFGQTNYVAAKAGVIGMTRVWARELGRYNITANAVAPGFIATEMPTQHARKGPGDDGLGASPPGASGSPRTSPTPSSSSPPTKPATSTAPSSPSTAGW